MSDISRQQQFSTVMARLRANYIAGLADKSRALCEALEVARAGDNEGRANMTQIVHRLAGTAGSFGLGDVSARANDLDIQLREGVSLEQLSGSLQSLIQLLRDYSSQ